MGFCMLVVPYVFDFVDILWKVLIKYKTKVFFQEVNLFN